MIYLSLLGTWIGGHLGLFTEAPSSACLTWYTGHGAQPDAPMVTAPVPTVEWIGQHSTLRCAAFSCGENFVSVGAHGPVRGLELALDASVSRNVHLPPLPSLPVGASQDWLRTRRGTSISPCHPILLLSSFNCKIKDSHPGSGRGSGGQVYTGSARWTLEPTLCTTRAPAAPLLPTAETQPGPSTEVGSRHLLWGPRLHAVISVGW